jgi:hypothetical protein
MTNMVCCVERIRATRVRVRVKGLGVELQRSFRHTAVDNIYHQRLRSLSPVSSVGSAHDSWYCGRRFKPLIGGTFVLPTEERRQKVM